MATTDTTGAKVSAPQPSKARSKGGVPRVPLATAESYARAVWDTAKRGEAAPVAVARTISGKADAKAEGGAWRSKVAALRAFHLLEKVKSDNLKLSDLGFAVVNGSDLKAQIEGRRRAILGVEAYRKILGDMDGHPLPTPAALAGTFEFEYELPAAAGVEATTTLIASLKHAEMLTPDGILHIDSHGSMPSSADLEESPESDEEGGDAFGPDVESSETARSAQVLSDDPSLLVGMQPSRSPAANVKVTIDMSQWSVGDVLAVLQALGYGAGETE